LNINEYIASGILEEYILGQLSASQREEVEAMAAQHPEVREELKIIEEALAKYGMAHARPMPAALKQNILSRVAELEGEKSKDANQTPRKRNGSIGWFMALIILAALVLWSLFQNFRLGNELKDLQLRHEQSIADCDSVRVRNDQLAQQLAVLKNPGLQLVYMLGTEKSKSSQVVVHYNPTVEQTFLRVDALPAPAPGKQYQLWAIVGGAPVSMGVFDIPADTTVLISVPHVADAQAFAVTLENAGGVASPTLEEMYVIGNVGG
jgi:anti-sigma-K factor RskA